MNAPLKITLIPGPIGMSEQEQAIYRTLRGPGRILMKRWQAEAPSLYRDLLNQNLLEPMLQVAEAQQQAMIETMRQRILWNNPPMSDGLMARMTHQVWARQTAEELLENRFRTPMAALPI